MEEAIENYNQLKHFSETRFKELSEMYKPFVDITDTYGQLISRITSILGNIKPKDTQDIVIRDLMADIFDFLYESKNLTISGKCQLAFPLARRAYESLSLLHLCTLDKKWAEKWEKGKKIGNAEIRKELDKHPMGENKKQTKELYNFFCTATHPNRVLIPYRYLGDGNLYVLGAIGQPNLMLATDYCLKNLDMWFWLTATVSFFYKDVIQDKGFFKIYHESYNEAKKVNKWLVSNFNHLLKEFHEEYEKRSI